MFMNGKKENSSCILELERKFYNMFISSARKRRKFKPDDSAWYYMTPSEIQEGRKRFLTAIEEEAPQVLRELRKVHLRLKEYARKNYTGKSIYELYIWGYKYRLYKPLKDSILIFGSQGDWIVQAGMRTLAYWDTDGHDDLEHWSPDAARVDGPAKKLVFKRPYKFETRFWNPSKETRKEFEKRVLGEVKVDLHSKLRKLEVEAPQIREDKYFKWLVMYQIKKKSFSLIARESKETSPNIVPTGVKKVAKLLFGDQWELWLRPPDRGGRPKKR